MIKRTLVSAAVATTLGLFAGCGKDRRAEVLGAVVVAQLAQTQSARPSDFVVDRVQFVDSRNATVEASQRIPASRDPKPIGFVCSVTTEDKLWNVDCKRLPAKHTSVQ